jgi:5-enolpyruvylshikimate-3-phosphate synthase
VLGSARAGVSIEDPGVVAKSWPEFWSWLDLLRAAPRGENGTR